MQNGAMSRQAGPPYARITVCLCLAPSGPRRLIGWRYRGRGLLPFQVDPARQWIARPAADRKLASRDIHELPTDRGCTCICGARDFASGLRVSQGAPTAAFRAIEKIGVGRDGIAMP
ncbi:hypothetical protein GCM10023166_12930 [Paeniglutamicibacter cryotolerans]